MIVLDQLPLLIAIVFGQQSSAERHPLGEQIRSRIQDDPALIAKLQEQIGANLKAY
jgi:hypothetical protein